MIFEWDEAKSLRDARDRRLPSDIAVVIFDLPTLETIDTRRDYGERRVKAIGTVNGLCMVCIYTDRGEVRRIISPRLAKVRERDDYRAANQG